MGAPVGGKVPAVDPETHHACPGRPAEHDTPPVRPSSRRRGSRGARPKVPSGPTRGTTLQPDKREVAPWRAGEPSQRRRLMYTDHTHADPMGTRTISLADDAYEALSAMKRPGESFSDVVRRLTRRRSLTELADTMDDEAAEEVAEAIETLRDKRIQRRQEELDLE